MSSQRNQWGTVDVELPCDGLRLVEQRETDHATKLQDLRDAVQLGVDSIEAGHYTVFESAQALADDFRAEAERIIAEAE